MKRPSPGPDCSGPITVARVERAIEFMTYVVREHGEQYTPILERLRRDLNVMSQRKRVSKQTPLSLDHSAITDDTPLRLETAAQLAFPDGGVSKNALRSAAARSELEHERLAGRIITTLRWVREWRERNRHPVHPRPNLGQPPVISEERREAAKAAAMQVVNEMRRKKKSNG